MVGPQSLRTQPGLLSTVLSSQDRETGARAQATLPCPGLAAQADSTAVSASPSPPATALQPRRPPLPPCTDHQAAGYDLGPSLDSPPHRAPPGWSLPARPRTCPPVCPLPHPGLPSIRENHGPARHPTAHPRPRLVGPPTALSLTSAPLTLSSLSPVHSRETTFPPPGPVPSICLGPCPHGHPSPLLPSASLTTHTHARAHTHTHTQLPDSKTPACRACIVDTGGCSGLSLAASSQGPQLYTVDRLRFPPDPSLVPDRDCQPIPHSQHTKGSSDTPPHHDSWKQVLF